MRAFDLIWCDPTCARLGFEDFDALALFSDKIVHDQSFRADKQQELMELYLQHDNDEIGILNDVAAIAFIESAIRSLSGDPSVKMSEEQKLNLYNAVQSLDTSYNGMNLDDFMTAVSTMATWRVKGRTEEDVARPVTMQERIKVMIESSFSATKVSIDSVRNEIEVERLQLLAQKNEFEADKAEHSFQKLHFESEKKEFE